MKLNVSESNVMQELKAQNPDALDYLMTCYAKSVYTLVFRILWDFVSKEDLEECVSDVFVRAWQEAYRYDSTRGSVRTWLLNIAKFTALDVRRKRRREAGYASAEEYENMSRPDCRSVEETVLSREQLREVAQVIQQFSKLDQEIFCRRYVLFEDVQSIADACHLSRGAVDTRLWRCRSEIKKFFADRDGGRIHGI